MITSTQELHSTLRYLTSLTDMLTAMYLDAKERNDFTLFPVTAEGYFAKVQEVNAEVRAYLQSQSTSMEFDMPLNALVTQETT